MRHVVYLSTIDHFYNLFLKRDLQTLKTENDFVNIVNGPFPSLFWRGPLEYFRTYFIDQSLSKFVMAQ